jgi:RNA ligase
MTAQIHDVFDENLLAEMLATGYVKRQAHPEHGYWIYNYTQHTQFDRVWNEVTRNCRGLITDAGGRVLARPFPKFFNLAEHHGAELPVENVIVTDKLDGSLGILYPTPDGHRVATRGSFVSEQAEHATRVWRERYQDRFEPEPSWTYLFEIVYPENRIVVDYHDLDDLVLLGAVETRSGRSVALEIAGANWPGPKVEELPYRSLEEALAAPVRDGREGLVLHFSDTDLRVKVKYEEYVRLHRLVTGVSERRIWEALSQGHDIAPWLEAVPDEFYHFVRATRERMLSDHQELKHEAERRQRNLLASLEDGWTRKDYAEKVNESDWALKKTLFSLLDGKSIDDAIWQHLRPEEHRPLFSRHEDTN